MNKLLKIGLRIKITLVILKMAFHVWLARRRVKGYEASREDRPLLSDQVLYELDKRFTAAWDIFIDAARKLRQVK